MRSALLTGLSALLLAAAVCLCGACGNPAAAATTMTTTTTSTTTTEVANCADHEEASDYEWDESDEVKVVLADSGITITGSGASASGSVATIAAAGTYRISGSLSDGQIVVNAGEDDLVRLVLDGVSITCATSAPIYVASAGKAVVILAEGSTNALADASASALEAALYSKSDLSIYGEGEGTGTLTVAGNCADGIASADGLVLDDAAISVTAADDGIRGKDYLAVRGGKITVNAVADGLKSTNDEDASKGWISIESGTFTIVSGNDALQAETNLDVAAGTFTLTCGGGSACAVADDASAKGIKGSASVDIDGGTFSIDSADDCVHSDGAISIDGGSFALKTYTGAGDGIHADGSLTVNGGTIVVSACYEGLEGSVVTIAGGNTHIVAADDGVNVSGDADTSLSYWLYITGGYLCVDASGDGLDSNGSIAMSGGTVIVNGPTANDNAALDYAEELSGTVFTLTGGTLVAAGSAGMAVAPSSCGQPTAKLTYSAAASAGSLLRLQSASGAEVLTFAPSKKYQSVIVSSPSLVVGTAYYVYTGGADTASQADGLYETGGTYSGGTSKGSFTAAAKVSAISVK